MRSDGSQGARLGGIAARLGAHWPRCPQWRRTGRRASPTPFVLPPFDPQRAGLRRSARAREGAWALPRTTNAQFIEGVGAGLAAAAKDRGLALRGGGAPTTIRRRQAAQIERFLARRFGAVVTPPVDPAGARADAAAGDRRRAPMSARWCRRRRRRSSMRRSISPAKCWATMLRRTSATSWGAGRTSCC